MTLRPNNTADDDRHRRYLGATGVRVSRIGLGTLMLGPYGNDDRDECRRIINTALDHGIDLIDTADGYSDGESEVIVGQAIRGRRDQVFLATKFGMRVPTYGPNAGGTSRRWVTRAVEGSLRRLETDRIDLYQIHSFDPATAIEETLEALHRLVEQGKVLYVGSSNFAVSRILEAEFEARQPGRTRLVSEQLQYSLLDRRAEAELLPVCHRYDKAVLVWSPLHGGWLTDRAADHGHPVTAPSRMARVASHFDPAVPGNAEKLAAVRELREVARELSVPVAALAVRFCTAHSAVASALVGPSTIDELTDVLPAITMTLDDEVLDRLDAIAAPGSMVGSDHQTPPGWFAVPQMRRVD